MSFIQQFIEHHHPSDCATHQVVYATFHEETEKTYKAYKF